MPSDVGEWTNNINANKGHGVGKDSGFRRARPALRELSAAFEYLLVSAPPAAVHPEAALLGPLVDGVVLVVHANTTRREAARRVIERLQAAEVNVLGTVLANRTYPIPEAIYRKL